MPEPTAPGAADASYDPSYFAPLFAVEDRHFWFRARNHAIGRLASQVAAEHPAGTRVLEVGCGTGNVLRTLAQVCPHSTLVGMDFLFPGLEYARRRTACPLVRGDIHAAPFRAPFHLIGLFDVLEHLADDGRALRDLHAMLAVGGALLLTVPAHRWLWSYFDEAGHHCRRYERAELHGKLIEAGYRVEYISEYMASILPLVWLRRLRSRLPGARAPDDADRTHALATDELRIVPGFNALLAFVLALEARLIARRRTLPIGTGILALARKDAA